MVDTGWTHDPGFVAVIALAVLLGLGFIYGTVRNRRLLELYLQALRPALLRHAGKASARRLGTSGYRIVTRNVKPPFRQIDALIYVQPREILPYWLFNLLRGRGDRVYLQIALQRAPRINLQAGPLGGRPADLPKVSWREIPDSPWRGVMYATGDLEPGLRRRLEELAALLPSLEHLSIRRAAPHVSLVFPARVLMSPETVEEVLRVVGRI